MLFRAICLTCLLGLAFCSRPAGADARDHLRHPAEWYSSEEGRRITANILTWQGELGGWPKNTDTASKPYAGTDRAKDLQSTFDNGATTDELRYLAKAYNATHDQAVKDAFGRGSDYILKAQYPNGGWPQYFPPGKSYNRYITFNDNAMVRLMEFLRQTYTEPAYEFLEASRKDSARRAFEKGIDCILKCQITINGNLTAWCAQHDEIDFHPVGARTFELASMSGAESVGITRLLMSLDQPSPQVIQSVEAAVAWFESAKLTGVKVIVVDDPAGPKEKNKVMVEDATALPLWARFYDLKTNRPIYVDRDGVPKPRLDEIGYERRNGYAWTGNWPAALLEKEYPQWRKKWKLDAPK